MVKLTVDRRRERESSERKKIAEQGKARRRLEEEVKDRTLYHLDNENLRKQE